MKIICSILELNLAHADYRAENCSDEKHVNNSAEGVVSLPVLLSLLREFCFHTYTSKTESVTY